MRIEINGTKYYLKQNCRTRDAAEKLVEQFKTYGHRDAMIIEDANIPYPYRVFATRYNRKYVDCHD